MLMDYHMHSKYSTDGKMTMEDACIRAIELGIDEIAFTDHIDLDLPYSDLDLIANNMENYISDIEKMKEKFKNQLIIKKGIEIGLQPHVLEENSKIINSHPFDFVIGSVHSINRMDPYLGEYYKNKTKEESYRYYYQEILNLVTAYDDFDVLGHLDYIRRYSPYPYNHEDTMLAFDVIEEILKTLINKGKGIEVNTSGYRHISNRPLPDFPVIQKYRQLGGEIITVGSDAHSVEHIGYKFKDTIKKVNDCGFQYLTSFKERKPLFKQIHMDGLI